MLMLCVVLGVFGHLAQKPEAKTAKNPTPVQPFSLCSSLLVHTFPWLKNLRVSAIIISLVNSCQEVVEVVEADLEVEEVVVEAAEVGLGVTVVVAVVVEVVEEVDLVIVEDEEEEEVAEEEGAVEQVAVVVVAEEARRYSLSPTGTKQRDNIAN